ncbi:MAG: SGNH/GDSL hydrolase family protein [Kiritimatiellae bacterium]|nr:SGNH/GDSL hydrolase family protein [Kiritimatiellia bacterium]
MTDARKSVPIEYAGTDLGSNGKRLESPAFAVEPLAFYRLVFEARAGRPGMWAAVFFDEEGRQIPDHYSGFDASADWQEHEYGFHARVSARTAILWFHPMDGPPDTVRVRRARVEPADRAAVARWADGVYAGIPPLDWQAPPGRHAKLPKTLAALRAGAALRVVMLGDSIVNDTGNSAWNLLVERRYPGSRIDVITSVRGGTGCTFYREPGRVEEYVLRYKPDLLMIGGISHRFDLEAIRSVIRQVREKSDPEILLMTDPVGTQGDPRAWPEWLVAAGEEADKVRAHIRGAADYRLGLRKLAEEEGCAFLDIGTAWQTCIAHAGKPYLFFLRDPVHCNHRGRQVLARVLERFFSGEGK